MIREMNTNMKPRTIIGIIFIVASLLKLATLWGILHWHWFETVSEGPWAIRPGPVATATAAYR